MMIYPEVS